jgi:hypothetical protein
MNTLKKLWCGLYPLPIAFWGFYVCGFFVWAILGGLLIFVLDDYHLRSIGLLVTLCIGWIYMFIATVGVWQSAGVRMKSPIWMARVWAVVARVVVGFYAVTFLWRLADGGALTVMAMMTGRMDALDQ